MRGVVAGIVLVAFLAVGYSFAHDAGTPWDSLLVEVLFWVQGRPVERWPKPHFESSVGGLDWYGCPAGQVRVWDRGASQCNLIRRGR